jgi:hypothetical protein
MISFEYSLLPSSSPSVCLSQAPDVAVCTMPLPKTFPPSLSVNQPNRCQFVRSAMQEILIRETPRVAIPRLQFHIVLVR